ncbi:MAG: hypothetical protein RL354_969 [Planctomycetota bacterium]|jgi:hypothetical protein
MRLSKEQLLDLLMQRGPDSRHRGFRPFRLVFRTSEGIRVFESDARGKVGYLWELGRLHLVRPEGGLEVRSIDELIDASFIDELDTPGDARAVG